MFRIEGRKGTQRTYIRKIPTDSANNYADAV